jgi:hypothetical protein
MTLEMIKKTVKSLNSKNFNLNIAFVGQKAMNLMLALINSINLTHHSYFLLFSIVRHDDRLVHIKKVYKFHQLLTKQII